MSKKWSLRIGWGLIGLVVALFWGEVITRAFYPQNVDTILDILQGDPIVGYIYEPEVEMTERGRGYEVPFITNSLGLRDRRIGPKADDVYRVMLIGNSFSVSHGIAIENSLSRVLEDELNRDPAALSGYRAVEVVNTSNAGYNAYNYWKGYERWAPVLHPDLVVVGFVPEKEYQCDPEGTRYLVRDGLVAGRYRPDRPPAPRKSNPLLQVRKSLARNSHFYVLLRNFFYYNEKVDRLLQRGDGVDTALKSLRPYRVPTPEGVSKGWDRAFGYMRNLRDEAAADGAGLIILAIPQISQIDEQYFAGLAERTDLTADQLDRLQPLRKLEEFCGEAGIPLLDMTPGVTEAQADKGAYLFDNHLNADGIAEGGAAAVRQWRRRGLPPFVASGK